MNMEIWKDIKGYEGLYQVSSKGRIRSFYERTTRGGLTPGKKPTILAPQTSNRGYYMVTIYKDGVPSFCLLHRLIAETFIPNPNNYPIINHKDEVRTNNCIDNLEWCTYSYNNSYNDIRRRVNPGYPVIAIGKDGEVVARFNNAEHAAMEYKLKPATIRYSIINNRPNKKTGFCFRYEKDSYCPKVDKYNMGYAKHSKKVLIQYPDGSEVVARSVREAAQILGYNHPQTLYSVMRRGLRLHQDATIYYLHEHED